MQQYIDWFKNILRKPDKYAHLKRFSLFKDLNSFELYLLNNHLHTRNYKAGEVLFEPGYPLEAIYLIEKGEIEIIGPSHPSGHSILKKNQFLGLMDMFHENIRSSKATTLCDVQVLAVSQADLKELIDKNPRMGVKILLAVCSSFSNYIFHLANPGDSKQ